MQPMPGCATYAWLCNPCLAVQPVPGCAALIPGCATHAWLCSPCLTATHFACSQATRLCEEAWAADSRGQDHMSRTMFNDSLFELADMWTLTTEAAEYAEFLEKLLMCAAAVQTDAEAAAAAAAARAAAERRAAEHSACAPGGGCTRGERGERHVTMGRGCRPPDISRGSRVAQSVLASEVSAHADQPRAPGALAGATKHGDGPQRVPWPCRVPVVPRWAWVWGEGRCVPRLLSLHTSPVACVALCSLARARSRACVGPLPSRLRNTAVCRLCTLSLRLTDTVDGIRSLYTLSTENIFKTYNTLSTV